MPITQSWVGYLDRSYEQIKRSMISRLVTHSPEITDHTESNILIVIISMFAGMGEMLGLYIDSIAREAFLSTARKYESVIKLVRLINYQVKARNYATADVIFQVKNVSGVLITPASPIVIPKNTILTSPNNNLEFVTLDNITIPTGISTVYAKAGEFAEQTGVILGETTGANNQNFILPNNYVHNSITIVIDGEDWVAYNSFGLMVVDTKGFVVNILEDGNAYVFFGDGVNGEVPITGNDVIADFKTSNGLLGNLPPNSITSITSVIAMGVGEVLHVTNPNYAVGGLDFESLENIRDRAPRSIRTLERAVTYQDYLDLCLMVLGVGAAELKYCCGKFIDIYIIPSSKGIATLQLLQNVREYLECRKMITTQLNIQPAGLTRIWVKANIYGKPLSLSTAIYDQVVNALDAEFGFPKIKINRKIAISDIIAEVESLSTVDRIEISEVRVEPFARPTEATVNPLNITFLTLPQTTVKRTYKIIYNGASFEIYKDTYFLTTLALATNYADGTVANFRINAAVYTTGDTWEFTSFPSYPEIFPLNLISIDDFSAPIIDVGPLVTTGTPRTIFGDLTIITQSSTNSCLPPC